MSDCLYGVSPVNYPDPDPLKQVSVGTNVSPLKIKYKGKTLLKPFAPAEDRTRDPLYHVKQTLYRVIGLERIPEVRVG